MKHPFFDGKTQTSLTPEEAVRRGKLLINLPIGLFFLLICVLGIALKRRELLVIAFPLSFVLGWLWWSFSVPKWCAWAIRNGADEHETQLLAESGLSALVWHKGHFLEKTEFRSRNKDSK